MDMAIRAFVGAVAILVCLASLEACKGGRVAGRPLLCGDGQVGADETCDPPESCPTTCQSEEPCQVAELQGAAETCTAKCVFTDRLCGDDDQCCPPGCEASDNDCPPPSCGGVTECIDGDLCCPPRCNFGDDLDCDPCNDATECVNGDGCCPVDCGSAADSDCPSPCAGVSLCQPGDGCCPSTCSTDDDGDCAPPVCDGVIACQNGDGCCPADCAYDHDADCTPDCTGVSECDNSDGCCPDGCNGNDDGDCSPMCGNNARERGETCDPCPASCADDGNPCTTSTMQGSPQQCDLVCENEPIVACEAGDGCCPQGCTYDDDDDCPGQCAGNSACTDDDGCCPSGCTVNDDSDCQPNCNDPAAWPTAWTTLEESLRAAVNDARAAGQTCDPGGLEEITYAAQSYALPVHPALQKVARCHSVAMAACQDSSAGCPDLPDRDEMSALLAAAGYTVRVWVRFLDWWRSTPQDLVESLLQSPLSCRYLMGDIDGPQGAGPVAYDHVGVGYVNVPGGPSYYHLWTIILASD